MGRVEVFFEGKETENSRLRILRFVNVCVDKRINIFVYAFAVGFVSFLSLISFHLPLL